MGKSETKRENPDDEKLIKSELKGYDYFISFYSQ